MREAAGRNGIGALSVSQACGHAQRCFPHEDGFRNRARSAVRRRSQPSRCRASRYDFAGPNRHAPGCSRSLFRAVATEHFVL